ncbi:hypothetical protein TELCIR_23245, partial [Teladorsagia circumcincta]
MKRVEKKATDKEKGKKGGWQSEANVLSDSLEMEDFKNKKASWLSQSEKRKLCIANAFIGGSRVVLLDEPTAGMDYTSRKALQILVASQKDT